MEFLEKLAALVPKPRVHFTRFHGILAPDDQNQKMKKKRIGWAELLARVFAIDMKNCRGASIQASRRRPGQLQPGSGIL